MTIKFLKHLIASVSLLLLMINKVVAQCPTIDDVLNKGYNWELNTNCPNNSDNRDEFGVVDNDPFIVKVNNYPPVHSFPISANSGCGDVYYFSFDTDGQNEPINHNVPHHQLNTVKTYKLDENNNYVSGVSTIIMPPSDADVGIPDFLMKYDGTKHYLSWTESEHPDWEWDDFVTIPQPYTPVTATVAILGSDEMGQNTTEEFIADINGGSGEYKIIWSKRVLPSGSWVELKNNPAPVNYFEIPCGGEKYYFYDDEHKVDLTIATANVELRAEIYDLGLQNQYFTETKTITLNPEPVTVRNILDSQDYGQLSVNSVTYNSGAVVNLDVYEYHNFETYDDFQNGTYLFRVWDYGTSDKSYLHADNLFIDKSQTVASSFHPTLPLSVTNNLEGGQGGSWQVEWVDKPFGPEVKSYDETYHAFDWNSNNDEYLITALNFPALNTDWQFQYWDDDITKPATRTEAITTANKNFSTTYKGHLRSNSSDAFNSNSQRKLVRAANNKYYLVYTADFQDPNVTGLYSKLWLTNSSTSDFNGLWDFETQLLDDSVLDQNIKNPSMDYYGDYIYIVCESSYGDDVSIPLIKYNTTNGTYTITRIATFEGSYFGNLKPVIAVSQSHIMVSYKRFANEGFKYWIWDTISNSLFASGSVDNTSLYDINPSLAALIQPGVTTSKFYMAWQYNDILVKYQQYNTHNTPGFQDYQTISYGSGCTWNYNPSIALHDNTPIVSWTGKKKIFGAGYEEKAVIKNDPENSTSFFTYGTSVDYSNINTAGSGEAVVTVSENDGANSVWIRRDSFGTYTWDDLSHDGIQTQVCNAANLEDMRAVTFTDDNLPYVITKSSTDFSEGGLSKTAAGDKTSYSRQGVVTKGVIEFVFNIEDVYLDGKPVAFTAFPDTNTIVSTDDLNRAVRTMPIYLTSASNLVFSHFYDVINDSLHSTMLSDNEAVRFKVHLMQEGSNLLAAAIDNITYNRNNLDEYGKIDYQLDCTGIPPGTYYLQLVTEVYGAAGYSLGSGIKAVSDDLGKKSYQTLRFDEINIPLTYILDQNHPNPFNPLTTITYQVEQAGHVQLKVYDISGREITTLVDSEKAAGRYQVKFNGSSLASGVYIYKWSRVNLSHKRRCY